jgi:arsenical pump membrane protein
MDSILVIFTIVIFALTTLFIMWRPHGINEAIPAMLGAMLLFMIGMVPLDDLYQIFTIVSGPAITIISTIIMCIVLESIGFFRWAAFNIVIRANGSGRRLFFYIILLCFLMTVFFNNDGSILITTPIIIHIVSILKIKKNQKLPYLFGGVFTATAGSLLIGVSNIANLIGLGIVGLDLNQYTHMVFVPSMIGIITLSLLLYLFFNKEIPKKIPTIEAQSINYYMPINFEAKKQFHPLLKSDEADNAIHWSLFQMCIAVVVLIRGSYFILSPLGIQTEWIAIVGAVVLILIRWFKLKEGAGDVIKKAPWHILVFAFGMYVTVYALNNTGITTLLAEVLRGPMSENLMFASFLSGILLTVLSNVMNNLPAVMLGTLMITDMGLDLQTMQVSYIAMIIGSDIGALLTPIGTLATLLWMFVLRRNGIYVSWSQYFKVAIMVIPITLLVTLLSLYVWIELFFL